MRVREERERGRESESEGKSLAEKAVQRIIADD